MWALHEKGFLDGSYDTNYIERHFDPQMMQRQDEETDLAAIAASIAAFNHNKRVGGFRQQSADTRDSWLRAARWQGLRRPQR